MCIGSSALPSGILLIRRQEDIVYGTYPPEIYFLNSWRKKTEGELGDQYSH